MNVAPPPPHPTGCSGSLAILAAAVPVSVIIGVVADLLRLLPFVMGVTMVIAMIGGAPILGFLRRRGRISWRSVAKGGLVAGLFVPLLLLPWAISAVLSDAISPNGRWIGAVSSLILVLSGFGVAGIVGAFTTWGLLEWLTTEQELPAARRWRFGLLAVAVVGAIFGGTAVPGLYVDRSCHNPMRDGRESLGPVAGFELRLPVREWPVLRRELRQFAATRHWSFRDPTPSSPDMQWFDASLCTEAGTQIGTLYAAAIDDGIVFSVYQPQGGDSWKQPTHALQRQLEARWPGKISYLAGPSELPAPPWPLSPKPSSAARSPRPDWPCPASPSSSGRRRSRTTLPCRRDTAPAGSDSSPAHRRSPPRSRRCRWSA